MFNSYYKDFISFSNKAFNTDIYNNFKCKSNYSLISKLIVKNNILSKSNNLIEANDNSNNILIYRSLWQKLINKYLQETVYFSINNSESKIYFNKLKSYDLSIYKVNDYKKFLAKFNKSLINGEVLVSVNNINIHKNNLFINNKQLYFKYIWKKKFYCYLSLLKSLVTNQYALQQLFNRQIMNNLYNSCPLFTIMNNDNKLIMADSGKKILHSKYLFHLLYKRYIKHILLSYDYNNIYMGLFFINPEDAQEYQFYIKSKHLYSSRSNYLKPLIGSLHFYYNLINKRFYNMEFRLIPDLKEVSVLVNKYQYYNNISFNKDQQYGKNFFKGQPIYIIESNLVHHKYLKEKKQLNFFYYDKYSNKKYKSIFLNYTTALIAWNQFRNQYSDYKLPKNPIIKVYNLEDFLSNKNKEIYKENTMIIPSFNTYKFINNNMSTIANNSMNQLLKDKIIYTQSLFKRIIWSLTSRQPIKL
uniref:Uncharacterized protein n=1 Tax=Pleonosporium borreri TaxID=2575635 RepID=A0A4D6WVV6_9FLOR|nr:hypothetical protein [Pleonosporium borreri]